MFLRLRVDFTGSFATRRDGGLCSEAQVSHRQLELTALLIGEPLESKGPEMGNMFVLPVVTGH